MPRVLVLWRRPHHLSAEQAERWARSEVRALLGDRGVRSAELTRLASVSPRHPCGWDWLLALEVVDPVRNWIDRGAGAEWLGDLRLLGMRPEVILVGDDLDVEGGEA